MAGNEHPNRPTQSFECKGLTLHATEDDSAEFIDIAARVTTSFAEANDWPWVYAVHIDNWFGPRWLGFRGKINGAAGIRNRTLKKDLIVPPFHPNRVLNATAYHRQENAAYMAAKELTTLHSARTSESNLNNSIRKNILYVWYSGNTMATRKGAIMIYYESPMQAEAFYILFHGDRGWRVEQHVGLTRAEVSELAGDCDAPRTSK